ncbi:MAG: fasciclin domain-containing protein [Pseudomonadota bacterium]
MKAFYKHLTVALLATTLIACGSSSSDDDDEADAGNIVEVAVANGSFTTLVTALQRAGLDGVLADESQTYTVFAPTDAAFTQALTDLGLTADQLLALPNLGDILLYHVIAGSEIDSGAAIAAAGTTVTTANTDEVGVSLQGGDLFINQARVEMPDVGANNGVIHVIDAVLLPTEDDPTSGTIAAEATAAGLSSLVTALQTAMLASTFDDPGQKFTVFAPTNAAFDQAVIDLGLADLNALLALPNLADILSYHVVGGVEINASAATAIAGNTVEMLNMDNMALSDVGHGLFANISGIAIPNVDANNGIVHVIDRVLLPPSDTVPTQTITEIVQADPATFSTLEAALVQESLAATLNGPGPFTVFAPTNNAFAALGTPMQVLGTAGLTDILLKHVVSGAVDSVTAFSLNGVDVPTLNPNGETISSTISSGSFMVDGAEVIVFDVQATNGVIHVIDAVIPLD